MRHVLVLALLAACGGIPVTINGKTRTIGGGGNDSNTSPESSPANSPESDPSATTAPSKFDEQEAPAPKPPWDPERAKYAWVELGPRSYYSNEVQFQVPGIYGVEVDDNRLRVSSGVYATYTVWSSLGEATKVIEKIEKQVRKDRTRYEAMTWNHPAGSKLEPGHKLVGRYYAYTAYDENNRAYDRWGGQGYYTNGSRFVVFDFDTDDYGLVIMLFDWITFGKQTPGAP
jgi:hypothetical protein